MSIEICQATVVSGPNDVDLLGLVDEANRDDVIGIHLHSLTPDLIPPTNGSVGHSRTIRPQKGEGDLADMNNSMLDLNLLK